MKILFVKQLRWLVLAGAVSLIAPAARGQDFVNSGSFTNNGTFVVKRNVSGLPSAVGGTFQYKGDTIHAATYRNLKLTGSTVKRSRGGDFSVNGFLEIAPAVTFHVQPGSVITLGDSLVEHGYLSGGIQKSENISAVSQATFAKIGPVITANGVALGITNVQRVSGKSLEGKNTVQSIHRYYDITSTINDKLNASLVFKFADIELNGHDPRSLELWRFNTIDSTWRRQGGIVDTQQRTVSKNGIIRFSIWTAADTSHLLGRSEYEWKPNTIAEQAGNRQLVKAKTETKPIIAKITDAFGNALPNYPVVFSIVSTPPGAFGQHFKEDTVVTDSAGEAKATLIIGSKPGVYLFQAFMPGLFPQQFTATAAVVSGDANNDFSSDVADLTSIVSHIRGTNLLTGDKLEYADINKDSVVDIRDIDSIRSNILNGMNGLDSTGAAPLPALQKGSSSMSPVMSTAVDSVTAKVSVELTTTGIRINMKNTKPIVGLQMYFKFKNDINISATDVVYPRSQQMDIKMKSIGKELRLVGYNLNNTPITADSGSLFRLPITPASLADIESVAVIISTDSNKAIQPGVEKILAPVNKYPTTFAIYQNYPNPFNGSTIIEYDIPDVQGKLKIAYLFIYDILGRKVKTLASGEHEAKRHSVVWDGRNDNGASVSSGVYFYQLIGKDYVSSKKMVYIK
ncbi:MAG: FlgD immunoglobulin-like domain containing protein [Bacteroidota bacterium]